MFYNMSMSQILAVYAYHSQSRFPVLNLSPSLIDCHQKRMDINTHSLHGLPQISTTFYSMKIGKKEEVTYRAEVMVTLSQPSKLKT